MSNTQLRTQESRAGAGWKKSSSIRPGETVAADANALLAVQTSRDSSTHRTSSQATLCGRKCTQNAPKKRNQEAHHLFEVMWLLWNNFGCSFPSEWWRIRHTDSRTWCNYASSSEKLTHSRSLSHTHTHTHALSHTHTQTHKVHSHLQLYP